MSTPLAGQGKAAKVGPICKPADEQRGSPVPAGPSMQYLHSEQLDEPPEGVQIIYANGASAAEGNKKRRREQQV